MLQRQRFVEKIELLRQPPDFELGLFGKLIVIREVVASGASCAAARDQAQAHA